MRGFRACFLVDEGQIVFASFHFMEENFFEESDFFF